MSPEHGVEAATNASVFAEILGRIEGDDQPFILGSPPASYGRLLSAAHTLSAKLAEGGCGRGTRVAICLDHGLEYVATLLAVWKTGGVSVLLGPEWTDLEKGRVLHHAGCRLAVADTPRLGRGEPERAEPVDGLTCLVHRYAAEETDTPQPGDAVLLYTSGTTGSPKGVVLTESGISANVRAVVEYLGLTRADASPVFTPTCYAYSLSQTLTHAWVGAALLPQSGGMLFPMEILQGVSQHRLTGLSATPTAFRILCELDLEPGLDLASVRYVMSGGQPLDIRLVGLLRSLFPRSQVVNMYGCSENSPRVCYHWVDGTLGMDSLGCFAVGRPVRGTRLRVSLEDGSEARQGQVGEVVLSGTSLMRGYWKDPEETSARLRDGWFHTRDLGYLDEGGLLHLTGRDSTVINIGNEKVSPEEVERILLEFPGVREAAVYGAPDPLLGESVHAQVVVDAGARVLVADLQRHCRERISGYKVPRRILVADEIPKTLYGKTDRKRLIETER